jgi:3-oxoacyl-[acyl-carrier-protein] synthase-3
MNQRMIEAVAERLGFPMERIVINIANYGNTSAASIPIALDDAAANGRLEPGDLVLMVGFGAGMTWSSAIVRWSR